MDECEIKLEEANALPLSIVIVGVGDATDFTNMDLLCEKYKHVRVRITTSVVKIHWSHLLLAVFIYA